ncbi:MAG: hypothetical protein JW982_16075 [Spirochaetes bacterium]|nr:hypothetical protein [Spirochaetota bacterium]
MVKFIKILSICAAVLFSAAVISAQDAFDVKAAVEPGSATVGEEVIYTVAYVKSSDLKNVEIPEKKKYMDEMAAPDSKQSLIPIFEITDIIKDETSGFAEVKYTFKLRYFRTGLFTLPEVLFYNTDNTVMGYKVPTVEIRSVVKDDSILPDEPPLELKGNYTRLIILILSLLAAGALIALLIMYIIRRVKSKMKPVEIIPPIEIFRQEVSELENKSYIQSGENELYCVEISRIFKKYLSLSMKVDAVEMTSEELIEAVRLNAEAGVNGQIIVSKVENITQLWDLSKFAEFNPSVQILEANLNLTKEAAEKIIWEKGNVRFRV